MWANEGTRAMSTCGSNCLSLVFPLTRFSLTSSLSLYTHTHTQTHTLSPYLSIDFSLSLSSAPPLRKPPHVLATSSLLTFLLLAPTPPLFDAPPSARCPIGPLAARSPPSLLQLERLFAMTDLDGNGRVRLTEFEGAWDLLTKEARALLGSHELLPPSPAFAHAFS